MFNEWLIDLDISHIFKFYWGVLCLKRNICVRVFCCVKAASSAYLDALLLENDTVAREDV